MTDDHYEYASYDEYDPYDDQYRVTDGQEEDEERVRQIVAELVAGTVLEVQERDHGLVVSNPDHPDRGQVHFDFDGGHVSWEHVVFDYWGTFECFDDNDGAGHATRDKIIATLTRTSSTQ